MFNKAKKLFEDRIDTSLYVGLFKKIEIDIMYAIHEKERIILIYATSGSGKTFLLNVVASKIKEKEDFEVIFIKNPLQESKQIDTVCQLNTTKHIVLFIDEAQLLDDTTIEKLRMVSDNKSLTLVLATHEFKAKEIFSKKHFKGRINYLIHLKPLNIDQIEMFISTKLIQHDFGEIKFKKSHYKLIYKFTGGNLREINKLLYRTFDVAQYLRDREIETKHILIAHDSILQSEFDYEKLLKKYQSRQKIKYYFLAFIIAIGAVALWRFVPKHTTTKHTTTKHITPPSALPKQSTPPHASNNTTISTKHTHHTKLSLVPMLPDLTAQPHPSHNTTLPSTPPSQSHIHKTTAHKSIAIKAIDERKVNVADLIKDYNQLPSYDKAIKIANIYISRHKYSNALEWAKKANQIDPEKYESWYVFALSLIHLNQKKKAKKVLQAYIQNYNHNKKISDLLRSIDE
ncbi:MAG: tetratricopeptide repeat protein [Epsilonproteobacteria bacterium]|nr:tetratricopeptide repeat protein [Campylobacterota bacterium]